MENCLYVGKVRHRRFAPKLHEFSYKLFMFCFDINNTAENFKGKRWYGRQRFNWFSFNRKNHLGSNEVPLDQAVREYIKEKTGNRPAGKIFLLTHLSCLGYCFNPISLYLVFRKDSTEIEMLIAEVTNTPWGERHYYVLNNQQEIKKNIYQYVFQKSMHVSPFMAMDYEYRLNFKLDDRQLILHMESYKNAERHFDATLSLDSMPMSAGNIRKMLLRFPLMTFKVVVAIHWEALKLLLKGVPVHAHPKKS
jgi:DUF1365 family protein